MRTQENIVERVAKLYAKAEDEATPEPEREELQRVAAKLLRRYEIDEALVAKHQGRQLDEIIDKTIGGLLTGQEVRKSYRDAVGHLTCTVARALGFRVVWYVSWQGSARVVGWKSEIEHAEVLLASLIIQLFESKKRYTRSVKAETGEYATAKNHKDFIDGFAAGVARRIRESRKQAQAEAQVDADESEETEETGESVALVLLSRDQQRDKHYEDLVSRTKIGKGRTTYKRVGSGYSSGFSAGSSASIGQNGLGSQKSVGR